MEQTTVTPQKKSLAQLTVDLELLERKLDDQPEITPEDVKQWSFVSDLLQTKVEQWIAYLDLIESQIHMAEQQKKRAEANLKRKRAVQKSLFTYLKHVLESQPHRKLESESGEIKLVKNPPKLRPSFTFDKYSSESVLPAFVVDEIPTEFIDLVTVKVLNKDKVKAALKTGGVVPHCEMIQETRVAIK